MVRSGFRVLFLPCHTKQMKRQEKSHVPILKSCVKREARPVAGVQESCCLQESPISLCTLTKVELSLVARSKLIFFRKTKQGLPVELKLVRDC